MQEWKRLPEADERRERTSDAPGGGGARSSFNSSGKALIFTRTYASPGCFEMGLFAGETGFLTVFFVLPLVRRAARATCAAYKS
jgi:hypothetical protein